ncbi:hypothetical protein EZV62_013089 [Acer yangbiense]|uniref:CCHC-type domain-containing protein n=1 Tax=Acer yangbiense TaxID=1000413 RepID=A0A5C7HZB5_9ROSI|nr:hypothetical protein EZV62_013089 [Acer yangbiense]
MCMNRRSAKWLAEQIGVAVELLSDSRECWGKYLRVKVQIDISKPLKRWLRLKLGKTEDIVVVGLKYERLPDFCFVCGRIGHVVKECTDELARLGALDGTATRFGQWLRAPGTDRLQTKGSGQGSESSFERDRLRDKDPNSSDGGSRNLQMAIDGPVCGLGPSTSAQSDIVSETGRGLVSETMGSKLIEVSPRMEVSAPKSEIQMQDPVED